MIEKVAHHVTTQFSQKQVNHTLGVEKNIWSGPADITDKNASRKSTKYVSEHMSKSYNIDWEGVAGNK